jgi:hypothetical protein
MFRGCPSGRYGMMMVSLSLMGRLRHEGFGVVDWGPCGFFVAMSRGFTHRRIVYLLLLGH